MNRAGLLLLGTLVLPLAGLGWAWNGLERLSHSGTEWDVPVRGYDPRDPLQGHYLAYSYDWPSKEAQQMRRWAGHGDLCLSGSPPQLATASFAQGQPCAARLRASEAFGGRYYVPIERVQALQRQLANPKLQGVVRIRLRNDGHAVPLEWSFRPRVKQP